MRFHRQTNRGSHLRSGHFSFGYLSELSLLVMVSLGLLAGLSTLDPTRDAATTPVEFLPSIYHAGFVGETEQAWCHRWGRSLEEVDPAELGEPRLTSLPFPRLDSTFSIARSQGPVVTTVMADHLGSVLIARDQQVCVFEEQRRNGEIFHDVDLTPDGDTVYVVSDHDHLHQWTWNGSAYTLATFDIPGRHSRIRVSPRGRYVAIISHHQQLIIWDSELRREINRFSPDGSRIGGLAWLPDEHGLAMTLDSGHVQLWDAKNQRLVWNLQADSRLAMAIAVHPDGHQIAMGCFDHQITLLRTDDGSLIKHLDGHSGPIRTLTYHHSGDRLLSAGLDGRLLLWSPEHSIQPEQLYPARTPL